MANAVTAAVTNRKFFRIICRLRCPQRSATAELLEQKRYAPPNIYWGRQARCRGKFFDGYETFKARPLCRLRLGADKPSIGCRHNSFSIAKAQRPPRRCASTRSRYLLQRVGQELSSLHPFHRRQPGMIMRIAVAALGLVLVTGERLPADADGRSDGFATSTGKYDHSETGPLSRKGTPCSGRIGGALRLKVTGPNAAWNAGAQGSSKTIVDAPTKK